jgi:hypothetical protein
VFAVGVALLQVPTVKVRAESRLATHLKHSTYQIYLQNPRKRVLDQQRELHLLKTKHLPAAAAATTAASNNSPTIAHAWRGLERGI